MKYEELPLPVREVCGAFVSGLKEILRTKLYGIYMHGAVVFPESGQIQDIDCHVVIESSLNDREQTAIIRLRKDLSDRFLPLGSELDAYFILLSDARKTSSPIHQLSPDMRDEWWALHCAHIRAGRYITLYGPEPTEIFPAVSWNEISAALEYEMRLIEKNIGMYPAYCILNLCRIIYSYQEHNAAVSKRFSGKWASTQFPRWKPLIEAALKSYDGAATTEDKEHLQTEARFFLAFAAERIREVSSPD